MAVCPAGCQKPLSPIWARRALLSPSTRCELRVREREPRRPVQIGAALGSNDLDWPRGFSHCHPMSPFSLRLPPCCPSAATRTSTSERSGLEPPAIVRRAIPTPAQNTSSSTVQTHRAGYDHSLACKPATSPATAPTGTLPTADTAAVLASRAPLPGVALFAVAFLAPLRAGSVGRLGAK